MIRIALLLLFREEVSNVWPFRKKEKREVTQETPTTLEDLLLQAGLKEDTITRMMALNIPTLSACVELISNTVAMLPIKLYKVENGQVTETLDNRVKLLVLQIYHNHFRLLFHLQ
jgi:phage portal protein BeeE